MGPAPLSRGGRSGYLWKMRNLLAASLLLMAGSAFSAPPAPDFDAKTPAGQAYGLNDFNGRVIVIEFWAHWSGAAAAAARARAALSARWANDGVAVLDVGVGEDAGGAAAFTASAAPAANETILLDPDKSVFAAYGGQALPTAVVIDKDGNIVATIPGADPARTEAAIRAALAR